MGIDRMAQLGQVPGILRATAQRLVLSGLFVSGCTEPDRDHHDFCPPDERVTIPLEKISEGDPVPTPLEGPTKLVANGQEMIGFDLSQVPDNSTVFLEFGGHTGEPRESVVIANANPESWEDNPSCEGSVLSDPRNTVLQILAAHASNETLPLSEIDHQDGSTPSTIAGKNYACVKLVGEDDLNPAEPAELEVNGAYYCN